MELTDIFLIVLVVVFAAGFYVLWSASKRRAKPEDFQSFLMLQNQMNEMARKLDAQLGESTRAMREQFSASAKIVRDVTERLTRLDETNKQVVGFADQLQNLQDILKNPKQRGILGEYYLETLLKNAFNPKQYQVQYHLGVDEKTGKELIVDAVLFFGDQIIPIDSKFSLENYNRIVEERDISRHEELENAFKLDLKKRIDETAKYIQPQKGTSDFAFMFIPAEGIYYDLLVNQIGTLKSNTRDLIDYAVYEKKVHIVSPTTFYVTLQSMVQVLRMQQVQESTKEILKNIEQLQKHLRAYSEYHVKVGNHLQTTVKAFDSSTREFGKIDKDFLKLTGEATGIEMAELEGPRDAAEVGEE